MKVCSTAFKWPLGTGKNLFKKNHNRFKITKAIFTSKEQYLDLLLNTAYCC